MIFFYYLYEFLTSAPLFDKQNLMSNQKESFDKLLEKYVFDAAAQFIDEAAPETQEKIINLFNQIGRPATSARTSVNSLLPELADLPAEFYEAQLERQWQEALRKPVRDERVNHEKYAVPQRLFDSYESQINSTVLCIGQLQRLLKRAQSKITDTGRKACLIDHYQSIIDSKAIYLTRIQALYCRQLAAMHV